MSDDRVLAKKSDITFFGDIVRSKKGITTSLSLEQVKEGVAELKGDSDEWQGDYTETGDKLNFPSGELAIESNGSYDVTDKVTVNVNVAGSGGGVDISSFFFNLMCDSTSFDSFQASTDYGNNWETITPENNAYTDIGKLGRIESKKAIKLQTSSTGDSADYAITLVKFSYGVNITTNNADSSVLRVGNISNCFILIAKADMYEAAFNVTLTGGGGAD
jgi:hypothetical protein